MARRKLDERNVRKLLRNSGGTVLVSLPKEFMRALGWKSKQKVVVEKKGKTLMIKDWKKQV